MMNAAPIFLSLILASGVPAPTPESVAVAQAIQRAHPGHVAVTSVLISGNDAVARGHDPGPVHQGLVHENGAWRIVCTLTNAPASAETLEQNCGFAASSAHRIAADEAVNAAAAAGNFSRAERLEQSTFSVGGTGMQPSESARLQLLRRLNNEMRMGIITRQQAIAQWNQVRFSVFLP